MLARVHVCGRACGRAGGRTTRHAGGQALGRAGARARKRAGARAWRRASGLAGGRAEVVVVVTMGGGGLGATVARFVVGAGVLDAFEDAEAFRKFLSPCGTPLPP